MKKIKIDINRTYKSYKTFTKYQLEGDLIVLSGINGSGKSQLLKIIANHGNEVINRSINQIDDEGRELSLENILMLSFRDNIDLGDDFGQFSVTHHENSVTKAWDFYNSNIKHSPNNSFDNERKTRRFKNGSLIFNNQGIKSPSWRSINKLIDILKSNYTGDLVFNLTKTEFERIIPFDYIWRNENDIIQQVGNIFYMACCQRVDEKIRCSETTDIFDNSKWLENAPWTILNQLFEDLKFKYRFKDDYEFKTPYMEENPKLRDGNTVRNLTDLSDGEKAILKLALISLDEEISNDLKLVLFDEYEAPLNPSLTEAFYYVINKFYIQKGIQVIITTHSPATISLAPDFAQFYEIFPQKNYSPKIVKVNQYDYAELKEANKVFYDKIKNQEDRILELEQLSKVTGNMLFVEDKYDQIYKIAYLKVKGVDDITEENFEEKFNEAANFSIHGNFSCSGLYSRLICSNTTSEENNKIICLFDFDNEGYRKYRELTTKKENNDRIFPKKEGTVREGLFAKHFRIEKYAMMIPIPERLEKYISTTTSSDCFIEIESLMSEEYLKTNSKATIRSTVLQFYKMKDNHKNDFWRDLFDVDRKHFEDFEPLFTQIEKIFNEN